MSTHLSQVLLASLLITSGPSFSCELPTFGTWTLDLEHFINNYSEAHTLEGREELRATFDVNNLPRWVFSSSESRFVNPHQDQQAILELSKDCTLSLRTPHDPTQTSSSKFTRTENRFCMRHFYDGKPLYTECFINNDT